MFSLKNLLPADWDINLDDKLYKEIITRKNPTAILFLIDQSGSMASMINYKNKYIKYSEAVCDMINSSFYELISRCTKSEGIRDYFEICIVGYGGNSAESVEILWENNLKGKNWISITELKSEAQFKEQEVETNIRGILKKEIKKVPFWFTAVDGHETPMGKAFDKAYELLVDWITMENHQSAYPPVVINITDGAQSDCTNDELLHKAEKIKSIHTTDGNVVLLNCHISNTDEKSVLFPLSANELPNDIYANNLFEASSKMPSIYSRRISTIRGDKDDFLNYKGMAYNANVDVLFNLIDIGTTGTTYLTK
jgi:hypothetical protein